MSKQYRRLSFHRWAWVHTLLSLGAWAVVISIYTPEGVLIALQQPIVNIWAGITIVGVIAAVIGIFLSVASNARTRVISVSVELFGLILAAIGPFIYLVAQFSLVFSDDFGQRIALTLFAYYGLSILLVKIAVVIPRYRKEATDYRKPH